MKNLILLFLAALFSCQMQAQFFRTYGDPGRDFQATQIRVLNGSTYISGWYTVAGNPANSAESGAIFRLDPAGEIDWIYELEVQTPEEVANGTRIYDFDFSDTEDEIVFVGATSNRTFGFLGVPQDNQCIIGVINNGTGNPIQQEAFNFRQEQFNRERLLRITNDPDVNRPDSYFISGLINGPNIGSPSLIDNYIAARVEIVPNTPVQFPWINEHDRTNGQVQDNELFRMCVLDLPAATEIALGGADVRFTNNTRIARLNFHADNGNLLNELELNRDGTVLDMAQIGGILIVVGQLEDNSASDGPFITAVDIASRTIISNSISFPAIQIDRFSRVTIDPISQDILVIGERINQNSVVCRFQLAGVNLSYVNNVVLDFGADADGTGLLEFENNGAYWADSRLGFSAPLNPTEPAAAVVCTDPFFETCETLSLELIPAIVDLKFVDVGVTEIEPLKAEPLPLMPTPSTPCIFDLCDANTVGLNFNNIFQVFHNSRAEYVTVADINQDGWMDFAVPDLRFGGTPQFSTSLNNQNLTFTNSNSATVPQGEGEAIEFIDLDGLNDLDIIVHRGPVFEVYTHQGGSNYSLITSVPVTTAAPPNPVNVIGQFRSDFDLVDYNNDQVPDMVITGATNGNIAGTARIAIYPGQATPPYYGVAPPILLQGLEAISYWETQHVDVDGFNGPDLFTAQAGFNGLSQSIFGYLNNGNNTTIFPNTPSLRYETPTGFIWPRGFEIRDIDNNTQPDLIVAVQAEQLSGGVPSGDGALLVSLDIPLAPGNYAPSALNWQVFNIPGQPVGIDIGDIDLDGDEDVVVAVHRPMSFIRIYQNDGTGNFPSFVDFSTPGGFTTEVQITDFDNNCCPDIVTAQWFGNSSYVFINACEAAELVIEGEVKCEDNPCNFNNLSGVPNQVVSATFGNTTYYTTTANTGAIGSYVFTVPPGTYTVEVVNANYGSAACNAPNVFTGPATGITPTVNQSGFANFVLSDSCYLDVSMVGAIIGTVGGNDCPFVATPCEDLIWEYCFEIENNSCTSRTITNITIDLPNGIDFGSINIDPLVECGTQNPVSNGVPFASQVTTPLFSAVVDYDIAPAISIAPGDCFSGCVQATFNGGFTLPVTATANVDYLCGETPAMDSTTVAYQDTCSCDPNLKLAYFPQSCDSPADVLAQPVEYTIHFSNIGQTAAFDIVIEDQLDSDLDWSTFQWLGSSHPFSQLSLANGLLQVEFNNINLAPGAAGWIQFSVKPNANSTNGTVITNYADITFDNNAPVPTNTTTTTINFSTASADLQINATEFCVGDTVVIDYLWTGTSAELNFTQNGVSQGQNIPAPPSGTQVVFVIPDASYVGLWEYELVAFDSITGCTDTATVSFTINDCICDIDDEIFMELLDESVYSFTSNLFDPTLNPGMTILEFHWSLGDGTNSTEENPFHRYDCRGLGSRTVKVCLYYVVELNGKICEAEICKFFEVCLDEPGGGGRAQLYPNPATDQVTLQADVLLEWPELLDVEIYTADGKLLRTHELQPDHDRLTLTLNYDYEGLVHVRVRSKLGEVLLEERFIKVNP